MCLFRWPILSLSHTHAPPNICRTCRTSIICCNVKMLYRSNLTAIHLYFFSAAVLSIMMEPFSLTSIYLRYVVAVASVYSISIKTAFLVTKCYRIEQGMRELACNDNPICVRPTLTNRAEEKKCRRRNRRKMKICNLKKCETHQPSVRPASEMRSNRSAKAG